MQVHTITDKHGLPEQIIIEVETNRDREAILGKRYSTEIKPNPYIPDGNWWVLIVTDNRDNKIVMTTTDSKAECEAEAEYWNSK